MSSATPAIAETPRSARNVPMFSKKLDQATARITPDEIRVDPRANTTNYNTMKQFVKQSSLNLTVNILYKNVSPIMPSTTNLL